MCRKPAPPRADNRSFPFCSARCKQLDLGKWLLEEYRVPSMDLPELEDESAVRTAPLPQELE